MKTSFLLAILICTGLAQQPALGASASEICERLWSYFSSGLRSKAAPRRFEVLSQEDNSPVNLLEARDQYGATTNEFERLTKSGAWQPLEGADGVFRFKGAGPPTDLLVDRGTLNGIHDYRLTRGPLAFCSTARAHEIAEFAAFKLAELGRKLPLEHLSDLAAGRSGYSVQKNLPAGWTISGRGPYVLKHEGEPALVVEILSGYRLRMTLPSGQPLPSVDGKFISYEADALTLIVQRVPRIGLRLVDVAPAHSLSENLMGTNEERLSQANKKEQRDSIQIRAGLNRLEDRRSRLGLFKNLPWFYRSRLYSYEGDGLENLAYFFGGLAASSLTTVGAAVNLAYLPLELGVPDSWRFAATYGGALVGMSMSVPIMFVVDNLMKIASNSRQIRNLDREIKREQDRLDNLHRQESLAILGRIRGTVLREHLEGPRPGAPIAPELVEYLRDRGPELVAHEDGNLRRVSLWLNRTPDSDEKRTAIETALKDHADEPLRVAESLYQWLGKDARAPRPFGFSDYARWAEGPP